MSRHILSDIENKIQELQLAESESCFVLSDEMQNALIKWIGNTSRIDRAKYGLSDRENILIERLFNLLEH